MEILDLLKTIMSQNASDLHITVGVPPMMRIDGELVSYGKNKLTSQDTKKILNTIIGEKQKIILQKSGQVDFSYSIPGLSHFRVNAYRQRGNYAIAFRFIPTKIPKLEQLGLPEQLIDFAYYTSGLILVTGPTGSGKSTTLASLINIMNEKRNLHILTLEDPIEYLHNHKKSIVNQREIGQDTVSYASALRAALREDPDVILIGEMRDLETISIAITAAETGHLVLSTLHTMGAPKSINRIIDVFPPYQQQQIRMQLSMVLQGIISQQLIKRKNQSGRVIALEIMKATPAIRNLIREGKIHQIQSCIQMGGEQGMITMDSYLLKLYQRDMISRKDVLHYSIDPESMKNRLLI
ncbi:type IV pilus twitching motility protein PilT [Garciella nitratireducens]|uniref:Twitching motility protein PilT n=1 Tax=Garciella nitratireducens DSM 15102 TaxID=1121911 RepID=A0A1T4K550_9FIRM|nr:type IV pilus twitching motility protein PilT [Garciella nitratireducens]RBP46681.1 twitching motility protein PilT [Garciella nitratireducens]SJZ37554.1 twitching motility protein PilT [Garciella nitratireducens DSM 15102]